HRAVRIGTREVRGVLVLELRGMTLGDLLGKPLTVVTLAFADARALAIDAPPLARGIRLREQSLDRSVGAVRVRQAAGRAGLRRLDEVVQVLGRVVPPRAQVVALQE